MTIELEKVVPFQHQSSMKDVGLWKANLILKRRTANIVTDIKVTKAHILGGAKAASTADEFHFEVIATLSNAVEPTPNPYKMDSTAWINDILDPGIWYAIYAAWTDYQESFVAKAADAAAAAEPGV